MPGSDATTHAHLGRGTNGLTESHSDHAMNATRPDGDHEVHSHGQHAGHSTAMFKNRFWLSLALSVPVVYFSPMFGHLLGYMPPEFPGSAWIPPVLGTVIFFYGGQPFLKGGLSELKSRQPGHDAADRHGHQRRLRRLLGHQPGHRRLRPGLLVGAGTAGGHHAAGPLDRNARPRLRPGRAGRPGRTAARRGRTHHRRRHARPSASPELRRRRHRPGPFRRPDAGRRHGHRRPGRVRRIHDHRRVQDCSPRAWATRWSPGLSPRTTPSASGSPPSATTPRWPASSAWSPKRRRRRRRRRPWPTGPRPSSSTSPPAQASSPSSSGPCWAAFRTPSPAPSPCW